MTNYTPVNPEYSGTLPVLESSDAVSDAITNKPLKQLMDNDAVLKASVDLLFENGIKVNDVSGAALNFNMQKATLEWTDPTDTEINGIPIAEWAGTLVVRKIGSAPADKDDGTVVLNNTVRNAFSAVGWEDPDTLEYGTVYYYRFFPYTKIGAYTAGTALHGSPAREKLPVPEVGGSLTYDGTEQTQGFTGYDPAKMDATGLTGTNAGSYTAAFTPKPGYAWLDGSQTAKSVAWSIAKAAGSVTLSRESVELDADHLTETVTVTTKTGTISGVSTSDDSIATASVSGDVITISNVDKATGTAVITVQIAESANYLSTSAEIAVDAVFTTIYGAEWDGTSTTAWSRTDAAAGFVDPVPAVNNGNGSSPFDDLMPWSGMVTEERTGGTMVKIPKFWYKITQNGLKLKVQIADGEQDGFSVSPAHMDRGDGKGERDYVYVGRYHCHTNDYKSKTGGKPKANITRSSARAAIHNLGSNIWQMDFATRFTIWLLYIVEFADWNSQAKIGYGCGNNSSTENMGYTDGMTYHTGTTKSSRTTYGVGTQYRHIEGLWDNVYDWLDGCYYNGSGLNIIKNPSSFSDSSGGTAVGIPSSGYPSKFTAKDVAGTFPMFIPSEANGSESTYSCDSWYFDSSYPCLCAGGSYSQYQGLGLFFVGCYSSSYSSANLGCRLLELP